MADLPYRVGRKLGRTVYRVTPDGDEFLGVMDTPELGALVVDALNARTSAARAGYGQAIATLLGVAHRTGSLAAQWAADYLTADPDRLAPTPTVATPAPAGEPEAQSKDQKRIEEDR